MIYMEKQGGLETHSAVRDNLLNAITNFKITTDSLSKITEINSEWFKSFLNKKVSTESLSLETRLSLSNLSFMLDQGITMIDNDDRIRSVIDVLNGDFSISYETLALYSGITVEDINKFKDESTSIPLEKKYKLAVKCLFIHYILKK